MKSILVGVNGNDWSRVASDLAISWARQLGAHLTFIGILDVEELTAGQSVGMMGSSFKAERDEKVVANRRERIEAALAEAGNQAEAAGVAHEARFVEGSVAEELGREIQRHDLLMIGKRAEPRSDHEPGSSETMTNILRHASRPVVVTGPTTPASDAVVIAYDGSPQSSHALSSFVRSNLFVDSPLHVVTVAKDREKAEAHLRSAQDYLQRHGREAQSHALPAEGGVARSLIEFVERQAPALLVMGVYGKPRLQELLIGSVSKEALSSVTVPMFLDH